jgi:hypothetical protein
VAGTPYSGEDIGDADGSVGTGPLAALEALGLAVGSTIGSSVPGTPYFGADAQAPPSVALERPSNTATAVRATEPSVARTVAPQ